MMIKICMLIKSFIFNGSSVFINDVWYWYCSEIIDYGLYYLMYGIIINILRINNVLL